MFETIPHFIYYIFSILSMIYAAGVISQFVDSNMPSACMFCFKSDLNVAGPASNLNSLSFGAV